MLFPVARKAWHLVGGGRIPAARSVVNVASAPVVAILSLAQRMAFPPGRVDGFTRLCYLMGWYERETVAACHAYLRPGMIALDIGAHMGYFSRLFSKAVGPSGRVFAFEPHAASHEVLARNMRGYGNVTCVPKAVSDRTGEISFFEMRASGQHSVHENVRMETGATITQRLRVGSVSLDDFFETLRGAPISFIKMDIEGGEPQALEGMRRTVERSKGLVMIAEFSPVSLRAGGSTPDEYLHALRDMGFTVRGLGFDLDNYETLVTERFAPNLLCVRGEGR